MTTDKNNAAPDPQPAELAEQQGVGITDTQIDSRLNALYRQMVDSGQHNGGMSGVAWDRAVYRAALAARQPGAQEPVTVEAVATVRRNGDGDRYIYWLTEGGIADLEAGDVLMVSDRAITDEDGSGEVYAAPPAQGIDLGQQRPLIARSLAEWHEDDGNVMWWAWCGRDWAGEPAWCGTPNDSDWPGYHTHWTQHPAKPALIGQRDAAPGVGNG